MDLARHIRSLLVGLSVTATSIAAPQPIDGDASRVRAARLAAMDLRALDLDGLLPSEEPPSLSSSRAPLLAPAEVTVGLAGPGDPQARHPATETGARHARSGAQRLAYDSLIHKDRDRPGAIAAWGLGEQTVLRSFLVEPRPAASRRLGSEPPRDPYRLHGIVLQHDLPLDQEDVLKITGGWVTGSRRSGEGAKPPTGGRAGSAWSLGGTASLLARRLRLSLEYAASSQLHSGSDEPPPDPGDQAYRAGIEFRSGRTQGPVWHTGTEYSRVGPRFGSIANPALRKDRLRVRSYGGVSIDDWLFDVSFDRERNNLTDDPSVVTTQSDKLQFATTWKPTGAEDGGWFSGPRVRLSTHLGRDRKHPGIEPDAEAQEEPSARLRLETEFKSPLGAWGVKVSGGRGPGSIDATDAAGIRTRRLELFGDLQAVDAPPLKPTLSWQHRRDRATGAAEQRWRAALRSGAIAVSERLHADFDLALRQQWLSDTDERERSYALGGSLVWTLQRPHGGQGGLAFGIQGRYVGGDVKPGNLPDDGYLVMLTLSSENTLAGW